jgi:phospholipid/cholesterol/gamma-HCH transport system substrate-binding protein
METRANHLWVGLVTLLLLAGLALFFVWLARLSAAEEKEYDIFFEQSVGGLANGSQVAYSGVPVGQVSDIELWEANPELVRVRIRVDGDAPILVGTTASVSASFTGVSTISLNGARRGAPPITCETTACPEGVPLIRPEASGLGEILASAPLLLERLATLTDRLTRVLSDESQNSIQGILANTNEISRQLTGTTPEIEETLNELQGTLNQSTATLAAFEDTLRSTDRLLDQEGQSLAAEMRNTMREAQQAANALEGTLLEARPAARALTETTLPAANATLEDLRRTSAALRAITEKIDNQGASALVRGTPLPEYEP